MRRFSIIALAAILSLASCGTAGKIADPVSIYLADSISVLIPRCENVLAAAYMAQELVGERNDVPDWEGFPVKEYIYYTGDDIYLGKPKIGKVLMLNPTPEMLAKWVTNAVFDATGNISFENVKKVLDFIKWQSGGQFPISGVVYEDMYTKGFYEPYVFKDGITVYMADSKHIALDKTCTEEQLDFYLTISYKDLKPRTGRYARICSTTREMYYAAGGKEAVGDSENDRNQQWLAVVRKLYQKAWNSDKNELITAWAKSNLK